MDFGNYEVKHWFDLVELPPALSSVKPFAGKYTLQGLIPGNNEATFVEVRQTQFPVYCFNIIINQQIYGTKMEE